MGELRPERSSALARHAIRAPQLSQVLWFNDPSRKYQ
jgi:hypothetical protein